MSGYADRLAFMESSCDNATARGISRMFWEAHPVRWRERGWKKGLAFSSWDEYNYQ